MDAFILAELIGSLLALVAQNATEIINGIAIEVASGLVLDALRRR